MCMEPAAFEEVVLHCYVYIYICLIFEGSLEVKLPTRRTDGTAEVGRVTEEKPRSEKIREEKE